MKLRLPFILTSLLSSFPAAVAADYYQTVGPDQTAVWTDTDTWSLDSPSGTPATWDSSTNGATAYVTAGQSGSVLSVGSEILSADGFHLLGGSLAVTGEGTLNFSDNATVSLAESSELAITSTVGFGTEKKLNIVLGGQSSLVIGSSSSRLETGTYAWNVTSGGDSSIRLYLNAATGAGNFLDFGDAVGLKHVHVDGTLALNAHNTAGSSDLATRIGEADLHLANGSQLFINNNNSNPNGSNFITFANDIYLGRSVTFRANGYGIAHFIGDITYENGATGTNITTDNFGQFHLYGDVDLGDGKLYVTRGTSTTNARVYVYGSFRSEQIRTGKGNLWLENGANVTATTLHVAAAASATDYLYIKDGAVLTITGDKSMAESSDDDPAFVVARYTNSTGYLVMTGGELNILNADMRLNFNGKATVNMTGGTMNLLGIDFTGGKNGTSNATSQGNFYLGAQSGGAGNGIVNIGSGGIKGLKVQAFTPSLNLGQGTIRATADWKTNEDGDIAIHMISAAGTTFDPNGHTITINHDLDGTGKLILDGSGTLVLNGVIGHEGGTVISNGILKAGSLINNVTLNAGGTLIASALGDNIVINGGILQAGTDNLVLAGGLDLVFGSALWVNRNGGGIVDSAGKLTLGGDFRMSGGDVYIHIQSGDLYDQIVAESLGHAASSLLLESGTLNLMGVGETFDYTIGYDIFDGFAVGSDQAGISVVGYDTANWQHYWDDGTLRFRAFSIPEPTATLLLGLASLAYAGRRNRKA